MKRYLIIGAGVLAVIVAACGILAFWQPAFLRPLFTEASHDDAEKEKLQPKDLVTESQASDQPFALVRRMQVVQDGIISGDRSALQQQDDLLQQTAKAISAAAPGIWKDERNAIALAPYLLNGGTPQPVRQLLDQKIELGKLDKAIVALLAFAERRKDADALLADIDPLTLPRTAGAAVAMARGISMQSEPAKARPQFALAQLLAPGTVIDEGALRREIAMLVAEKKEPDAVGRAARYIWRFGRSVYSEHLTKSLAAKVLPELASKGAAIDQMKRYFGEFPAEARSAMLLDMARDSVLSGRLEPVAFLSDEARGGGASTPDIENRVSMYEAISEFLSKDPDGAVDKLISVDRSLLTASDLGLLDASLGLVSGVREPPSPSDQAVDPASDSSPIIVAAQDAVTRADKALLEMRK